MLCVTNKDRNKTMIQVNIEQKKTGKVPVFGMLSNMILFPLDGCRRF